MNLLRLLLARRLRLLLRDVGLYRLSVHAGSGLLIAREERHKRRQLEGHFLARRKQRYRLGLDQFQAVGPRIELDARSDRQCRNLVDFVRLQSRSRVREARTQRDTVAKVRVDERRKVLLLGAQLLV